MKYRIAKRFARVEAQGAFGPQGTVNDPADPLTLMIRVTDSVDVSRVIEEATTSRPSSGVQSPTNIVSELPQGAYPGISGVLPVRASTGVWTYDLTSGLYQIGKSYNVSWRYEMTPGNLKVDHVGFMWNPAPVRARESTNCVISDSWVDMTGAPRTLERIAVELYEDTFNPANRRDTAFIQTDIFGNWWIEIPRGSLMRFVIGESTRQIIVPDDFAAKLSDIKDAQAKDVNKDRFGYPLP